MVLQMLLRKPIRVVYFHTQDSNDNIQASIVMSKIRVAPLKRLTIPHLKLCGALLLSRVLTHVLDVLSLTCEVYMYAWTDSTVVLVWLNGDPCKFKCLLIIE